MAGPRWLDADENRLWMRLHAICEFVPGAVDAQLRKDSGLTRYEYYVLAMLSEFPGRSCMMTDLATATNGSLSRLSHAATRLERSGLITRGHVENNRRTTVATLTEAGWQKLVESAPGHVEEVRKLIFDGLTGEQVRALNAALAPLVSALELPEFIQD
ncbi:MAG TPA: MarR family transcriptional regulator [Microbacteriaceae bacterium]|nr:MarR family transcriptional regulator [Microbacteriaceae bacterium]